MSKTIFVSGNFNILHPGHLRLLRFAKELGDKLIVGVHSDEIAWPNAHVPEELRLEGIHSNSWVNECFLIDKPVTDIIRELKPEIVVKGKEHEGEFNPELEVLEEYGGSLMFSSGEVVFSSLDLIRKDLSSLKTKTFEFPFSFASRHDFKVSDMIEVIEKMSSSKVCVIGDLIIDEYITCDPLGMSQEDPTIVVTPVDNQKFLGGAAIVAAHAVGLGAKVDFYSISGNDSIRDFATDTLKQLKVNSFIIEDPSRPTSLKQRFRSKGKTLLRVSHLHQGSISSELQGFIFKELKEKINNYDLIIFSDFNYGCLPQSLVDKVSSLAVKNKIIQAADSQSSSQSGDVGRFKGMDLLTPTEHEARISLRNQEDGLGVIAEKLRSDAKASHLLLKLAEEGVLIQYLDEKKKEPKIDRLKAFNTNPIDIAGAGDSMLTAAALTLTAGGSFALAAALGSFAAAVQVSRMGNSPLYKKDLISLLREY